MQLSGCSQQFNFSFLLFVFKRTKNVNAFSPWNPSVVRILDTLMLLHGGCFKLTPGASSLAVHCFAALCYLVQQQVVSDSWYGTLRFSPIHLCLYSGARSKLFMIKHCTNSQIKIYWHKGGWEEGAAGLVICVSFQLLLLELYTCLCDGCGVSGRLLVKNTVVRDWYLSAQWVFSFVRYIKTQTREYT